MAGIARRVTTAVAMTAALGAAGTGAAEAQAGWVRGPDAAFIGLGVAGVSTSELDERLAARGYPTFGGTAAAPGIGAYWTLPGGLMLGGEWNGVVLGEEEHAGGEVGIGGGSGTLGVGYALKVSPRMRVYPRLGVGGGGIGLWIESDEEPVDFEQALTEPRPAPGRESVLSRGSVVVDFGGGVELRPGGAGRGPVIGIRFGYLAAPSSGPWQIDEGLADLPVTGGPEASLAGPYVRVIVGAVRTR